MGMSEEKDAVPLPLQLQPREGSEEGQPERQRRSFAERRLQWERATAAMIEAMPGDYGSAVDELYAMSYFFRDAISKCLQPRLNWELQRRPDYTHGDKKKLASWVNMGIADLGLTLYSRASRKPVILTAEKGRDGRGLFHYESRVEPTTGRDLAAYEQLQAFESVPSVDLRPADLHRPQWDKWTSLALEGRAKPRVR